MKTVPYGSWRSPITPELIVGRVVGLGDVRLDGDATYFLESRPAEGGRSVVMKRSADGTLAEVTPAPFNVRTRVHEYGGGAYTVHAGVVYFSNFADNRLYRVQPDQPPQALTPDVAMRYADACVDERRRRLICVREDHTGPGEAVNTLVSVPMDPSQGTTVLVDGCDFYSSARVSPDGKRLAWLSWNHPNMPWDGTELWVADIADDGSVASAHKVAGGLTESIFQPEFAPDGTLYFISDRSNWWNIYRVREERIEPVLVKDAEFGAPQWGFGMSTYGFRSADEMVCSYSEAGHTHVLLVDLAALTHKEIALGEFDIAGGIRVALDRFGFSGSSETRPGGVALYDFSSSSCSIIKRSTDWVIDEAYVGRAEPIEFPTDGGMTAHGYYYAPRNPDFAGPPDERPPLLVICHGGPTSATSVAFNPSIRYWTSRGFGVLDVNYGGSAGYGRAYRQRLNGQWGVVDVNDCT
ncbi:MAG: prolyl oligopeptidase family serine peptidase, partial [Firmicutes bacterium]|nr:prolyl oligopeptidase family serine peptidase [Bacillota bacterium]